MWRLIFVTANRRQCCSLLQLKLPSRDSTTMRSRICFMFAACVVCWLPSDAGVLSTICDQLTTGYHGNRMATSLDFRLPIMMRLGIQRGRLDISGMNVKRQTFWKGNTAGPLPTNKMRGENHGVEERQKAMRYG